MNKITVTFLLTIFIGILVISSAQADEIVFDRIMKTKTIDCGYYIWPPYFAKDPNTGKLSGINYDIMEAVARNLGFKLNWKTEVSVGDVAAALETNKIDMVCGSLWPSPTRAQSLTLTIPAFYATAFAYVRADDHHFDGDLAKANNASVTVAAIDGDYTYDLAVEKLPQAKIDSLAQAASGSELLLQVLSKKADLVISDQGLVNDFLKTNPDTLRPVSNIGPVRYYGETFALKRGEYQLKNMIDLSLNQLTNDGVMEQLVDRYNKDAKASFFAPTKSFIQK